MDWPDLSPRVLDEMAGFVDAGARHHAAQAGVEDVEAALRGWAGRVFAILSRWAREGENAADHAELDAIAGAMAQAGPDLARLVEACEALEREVGAARGALAETQGDLAQARGDLDGARGALAGALEWVADERVAREQAEARLAEREAGLIDLAVVRDALIGERVMLIGQLEEAEEALARQHAEVGRLRREAGALGVALDTALLRLGQREGDLARMGREQARTAARLAEAEGWVLRLARERHGLERQAAAEARRMAAVERDLARARRGGEAEVMRLRGAMAGMADRLHEQAARVAELEAQLAQAGAGREPVQERVEQDLAGQDLADRYGEIVTLTRLLCEGEDRARQHACEAAWMRDLWAAMRRMPGWWRAMPMAVQRRWQEERLRRRGLFDARAYRGAYRDVAGAGVDPLDHYIAHGMAEGRDAMAEDAA